MPIKLEFIEDGYEGSPLLLFWGGKSADVSSLLTVFQSLASHESIRVALHELPFIEPSLQAAVVAVSDKHGAGVLRRDGHLEWHQTSAHWDNAAGLLEPFAESSGHEGGFQFLSRAEGAQVIYSTARSW